MLKISKLADYAIAILMKMMQSPSTCYAASEVASLTGIALPTARKLLKALGDHGLLQSQRGSAGGYRVSFGDALSVVDVIEAIDGPIALTECALGDHDCKCGSDCQMDSHWPYINQVLRQSLSSVNLVQLASHSVSKMEGSIDPEVRVPFSRIGRLS